MLHMTYKVTSFLLGFDAFCLNKKFLVFNLVSRNLKIKYRRSFFGFFWTIISPLAISIIYFFVFKIIMKIDQQLYLPFILSGVLPWTFFSASLSEATESIVNNHNLISKIPVPTHVFPFVVTVTHFSTLILAFPIILATVWISGITPELRSLLCIPFSISLLIICYSFGTVLAMAYVYFRDLKHAIGLILQVWFYVTPIVYSKEMIPEKYRFLIFVNPVGPSFIGIQESIVGTQSNLFWVGIGAAFWSFVSLLLLRLAFKKAHHGLAEVL